MRSTLPVLSLTLGALVLAAGCGTSSPPPAASSGPAPEGAAYLLAEEPTGASGVKDARANSKSDDNLPANKAMVKVVDASGKPVAMDARKLLGLKELQTVVVRGQAQRDEAGNLTVLADGLFVRK
jgi:hypothetical protein